MTSPIAAGLRSLNLRIPKSRKRQGLLGGSWVVISTVISRITMDITYIRGLIIHL